MRKGPMRTTVTLDDHVLELVRRHARLRRQSLGKAISDLVRRGLPVETAAQHQDGVAMFQPPEDSPVVASEKARRLEVVGA